MSLFEHPDIDSVLLTYLSIDDLKVLSLINKYYYNLIKDILQPFKEFFATRDSLLITWIGDPYHDCICKIVLSPNTEKPIEMMFIQAVFYNNYDVVKYVYDKYNPYIPGYLDDYINDPNSYYNTFEGFSGITEMALTICIQKKTDLELVKFIVDVHMQVLSEESSPRIHSEYLTADYNDDERDEILSLLDLIGY